MGKFKLSVFMLVLVVVNSVMVVMEEECILVKEIDFELEVIEVCGFSCSLI